jgi:PP-loop superfamily ATP-utilizing enzyme
LKRIEQAERFVRWQLTTVMDETSNLRVRLLAGNRACIEIDADKVNVAAALVETWQSHFDELGFDSVTLRSFKSGSVATASA